MDNIESKQIHVNMGCECDAVAINLFEDMCKHYIREMSFCGTQMGIYIIFQMVLCTYDVNASIRE